MTAVAHTSRSPQTHSTFSLRPFVPDDYERWIEIHNRSFPNERRSAEMMRRDDELWESRFFRQRLLAEDAAGRTVGTGEVSHIPWQFHPDRYRLHVTVDPDARRQGTGTTLYDRLMGTLRERGAIFVRTETREDMTDAVRFALRRGFSEIQRSWESSLDVAAFDFAPFTTAESRVAGQGITLGTLAEELRTQPDPLPAIYELDCRCTHDVPSFEPITLSPFEVWVPDSIHGPNALHDAMFLAKDGARYVGLSFLYRRMAMPGVLQQGFTAVDPDYRGKGIAMALKLRTVAYARRHGYREIRTGNNTRNRPMLRINEAMGFQKMPAWVEYGKDLAAG